MLKWLTKKITKNYDEIPLVMITFNLNKYKQDGANGSCDIKIHPEIADQYSKDIVKILIDHIRWNYDMEKLSK